MTRRFPALLLLLLPALLSARGRAPLHGHFPYDEAPASALAEAGVYRATGRKVLLRAAAAEAFRRMAQAAQADGAGIVPISGFRPVSHQDGLWKKAVARRGSPAAAAKWVAPPGHSEHHTGWALDLGDAGAADTDVETAFEKTKAFAWMQANAHRFGFELSFPRGNPQGVSYEPWHWRFVGTDEARALFHPS